MFIMKLKPEFYDKVKSGEKTYEVRLHDEKRQKIGIGDCIIFKKEPDLIEGVVVTITDVKLFDSFEKMAQVLSIDNIGFKGLSAKQVADKYYEIYSAEDEKKYGVVAYKIEVLK